MINLHKEQDLQHYHELYAKMHEATNRKYSKLGDLTGDVSKRVSDVMSDTSGDQEAEVYKQEIMKYKTEMTNIGIEFYQDLIKVKTAPNINGSPEDTPIGEMLVSKQHIVNQSLFYEWVSKIKPDEIAKIKFLINEVMMTYIRSVIYDFKVEEIDDDFLDFWNTCHKIIVTAESWNISDHLIQANIQLMKIFTELQKKEKLVTFIRWYKDGFVDIDAQVRINPMALLSGIRPGMRRGSLAEDGYGYDKLLYDIKVVVQDSGDLSEITKEIIDTYSKIYDELGEEYGHISLQSMLLNLKHYAEMAITERHTEHHQSRYQQLYTTINQHFA